MADTTLFPGSAKRPKTIVDTVSFSIVDTALTSMDLVGACAARVLQFFPDSCRWADVTSGGNGFEAQRQLLDAGGCVLGWIKFGAKHGRFTLYFGGAGLRRFRERNHDGDLVEFLAYPGARINRVDIALDVYDHSIFSVDASLAAHAAGKYKLARAPQSPHQEIFQSDTNNPDFPSARTHYLGKRSATKRLRCYDKGLQLLGSMTPDDLDEYRQRGVVQCADRMENERIEEWTRVELVYTKDKRRPLTAEIFEDPDATFAGGYPQLAELLGRADGVRPKYLPREDEITVARMMRAHRESYGGLIYYMRHILRLTDAEIVDASIGDKPAARLVFDPDGPYEGEDEVEGVSETMQ